MCMALPQRRRQLALQLVSAAAWAWASAAVAQAQPTTAEAAPDNSPGGGGGIKVSFRPSVAIVVGIFTMIFSLTFLLLMYAKFCHPSSSSSSPAGGGGVTGGDSNNGQEQQPQAQGGGGVPKAVIESLPFFRFATLRGLRQGMECSVCLARFDDADLLRLLPRCRHAFHLACVDRWLQSNASCPLCRTRVDDADDELGLKYPSSARIVFGGGDADDAALSSSARFDDTAASGRDLLDIFVERVPGGAADADDDVNKSPVELDRHRHRIIVSDVVFKSRWSELNSAALLALDTEMMMMTASSTSGGRGFFFPPESDGDYYSNPDDPADCSNEASSNLAAAAADTTTRREMERKRLLLGATGGGSSGSPAARMTISSASGVLRSMSEIVSLPRLRAPAREGLSEEENRYQQRWLPIAQRTARWFAGRSRARGEAAGDQAQQAAKGAGGGACDV